MINNSYEIYSESYLGNRKIQEDFYLFKKDEEKLIAIVCDGIGGLNSGEIASEKAVNKFIEDFSKLNSYKDIPGFLKTEIKKIDQYIFELRNSKGKWLSCGTTIVAIIIIENKMFWVSAGDSKLLISRNNEMDSVVREHNYRLKLNHFLEQEKIDSNTYRRENKRGEQLISYLGIGNLKIYDLSLEPLILKDKDRLLLCTDGVYKTLANEEIKKLLISDMKAELISKKIIDEIKIKDKKNQDNATYILIEKRGEKI